MPRKPKPKWPAEINGHRLHPESLMMSYGYRPEWSEGALKCPIFQTSTFVFQSAEEGKRFFELAYGLREPERAEQLGLIYSRLNNPDLEILEDRLTLWDDAEDAAVFESGMAAIFVSLLTFLRPGDVVLHSEPLYGGTDYLLKHILPEWGVQAVGFLAGTPEDEVRALIKRTGIGERLRVLYVETPANPTNRLVDLEACARIARDHSRPERPVLVMVDNTFLGPLWQHPLKHGADIVLYSATKYIGGHSDVIAGAALGSRDLMKAIKATRTFTGSMAGPWTGWLLMRSLETLKIRMEKQARNARRVADFLAEHPKVERVYYLGHLKEEDPQYEIFRRQCKSPGAMISFEVQGGEAEAFRFLNSLKLIKLAVSLGGTESLAEHPATMTHSDVPPEEQRRIGIRDNLIRLSVGIEHPADLILDLEQALETV
ncbi:cystathionine gamma-synthase family protein [Rhodothermus profundi]|uniref:Methionine-gamma-lyase n=1 Tax=Rhodothermus profundi TaxID=633813 RepID=A0A1M6SYP7_9BACT|nr:cystathionine gamma-synthase family protein [Rhodothermus profundi]SHK49872.1 methionine-gamma-lyase [Rhodothermus profundi]